MRARGMPLGLYALVFLVFLYGPVLLMLMFSFNDSIYAIFPLKGFPTAKAYGQMVEDAELLNALRNSLGVGAVVAVVSTVLGLLAALAVTRYRLPGSRPVLATIMVPLVIPSIILAVALVVLLRRNLDVPLTLWTVGAGHVLLCIPFSMLVLIARLEGFDRSLEEAAKDLGETAWMTFWRVTFPLALPGIVASLLMCFTLSFDEYVLAFFLSGIEPTLPVFLWSQLRFPQRLPKTMALGSTILLASTLLVVAAELLRRRGVRSPSPGAVPVA